MINSSRFIGRHRGAWALALILAACGSAWAQEASSEESAASAEEAAAEAEAPEPVGLHRPMDGTNLETFERDLEIVKGEITEVEFGTLMNAIGYLRVYDLSANGDKEKVYQNLDGKTPVQIMNMVRWRTKKYPEN